MREYDPNIEADTACLAVSYIQKKGNIVGPAFKTPFIGPFLESVNPKFEEYYAKWTSGPLSCVSVFHKCVPATPADWMVCARLTSPLQVRGDCLHS